MCDGVWMVFDVQSGSKPREASWDHVVIFWSYKYKYTQKQIVYVWICFAFKQC
jgi:hypothetical protein